MIDVTKPVRLSSGKAAEYVDRTKGYGAGRRPTATFRISGPHRPGGSPGLWSYFLDTGEWCGATPGSDHYRIEQAVEELDLNTDLVTRHDRRPVTVVGKMTDGRLVVQARDMIGYNTTYVVHADGRVHAKPGMTSGDDVVAKPQPEVKTYYNIYDDCTFGSTPHKSWETAKWATKYGKTRVGILIVTKRGDEVIRTQITPTTPFRRTREDTKGGNPYA